MKKYIAAVLGVLLIGSVAVSMAQESKYATHATLSAVNFKASDGGYIVKAILGETDKVASDVTVYGRTGSPVAIPSAQLTSITTVLVSNASSQLASNDTVMIQWVDGTVQYNTCGSTTTSNTILGTATSKALTTSDKIYEVTTIARIAKGSTYNFSETGDSVAATLSDSPLRVTLDSSTNGWISVSALKR